MIGGRVCGEASNKGTITIIRMAVNALISVESLAAKHDWKTRHGKCFPTDRLDCRRPCEFTSDYFVFCGMPAVPDFHRE